MLPSLVIDGHNHKERGEGELVRTILERRGRAVIYRTARRPPVEDFPALLSERWSVVWFTGHCTVYRNSNRGLLAWQDGRALRRLFSSDDVKRVDARLIVLSSCHTCGGPFAGEYVAHSVVGHAGAVMFENSLVFAAKFMTELCLYPRLPNWPAPSVVAHAFRSAASVAVSCTDCGWRLMDGCGDVLNGDVSV